MDDLRYQPTIDEIDVTPFGSARPVYIPGLRDVRMRVARPSTLVLNGEKYRRAEAGEVPDLRFTCPALDVYDQGWVRADRPAAPGLDTR